MLNKLSTYLLSCGKPWMLAGDWNAHPTALTKTGFLNKPRGKLIAQPQNTCTMGKGSNIDYVVLCPRMATKYYSNALWTAGPITPHHPFFLNFTSAPEDATYQHRDKPKAFPNNPPIGCQRAPRQYTWAQPADAPVLNVAEAWKEWVANVELALCHRFDLDRREGVARYKGRSKGLVLTPRTLRCKPSPQHSHISDNSLHWRSIKALAKQADNLLASAEESNNCAECLAQLEKLTEQRTCGICNNATTGCHRCVACRTTHCHACLHTQRAELPPTHRLLSPTDKQLVVACLKQITKKYNSFCLRP